MHVLLTGATGRCGLYAVKLLTDEGHTVLATDRAEPTKPLPKGATFQSADLTSLEDIDALFETKFDGVIHLGAIPNPRPDLDDRVLHNNNVVGSFNIMRTAVDHGVKRIVQASSVNAHGLSYAPEGHTKFERFPITEDVERRPVSIASFSLIPFPSLRRASHPSVSSFLLPPSSSSPPRL